MVSWRTWPVESAVTYEMEEEEEGEVVEESDDEMESDRLFWTDCLKDSKQY